MTEQYGNVPIDEFWSHVDVGEAGECWPWTMARFSNGYGSFRNHLTHRIAYRLRKGQITDGLFVLHRCDNPPCCNPAHLFLGTQADNMKDKCKKGRHRFGVKCHRARLDEWSVLEMRNLRRAGTTLNQLVAKYGVPKATIADAVRGTTWRHLPFAVDSAVAVSVRL